MKLETGGLVDAESDAGDFRLVHLPHRSFRLGYGCIPRQCSLQMLVVLADGSAALVATWSFAVSEREEGLKGNGVLLPDCSRTFVFDGILRYRREHAEEGHLVVKVAA